VLIGLSQVAESQDVVCFSSSMAVVGAYEGIVGISMELDLSSSEI
jgi:hypothetical protein